MTPTCTVVLYAANGQRAEIVLYEHFRTDSAAVTAALRKVAELYPDVTGWKAGAVI